MIGTTLASRYVLERELGRGGMGVVFLARDQLLDREVAIKIVRPGMLDGQLLERFQREARVTARLDHPAIVPVHDIGEHEGSRFLVMPFIAGENLRGLIQQRKLSLGEVLDIGIETARALAYSHAQGVVHRDVKPENILVSHRPGEPVRIRITDFGLALASFEQRITQTGWMMGTPSYLSPEQVSGREVDGRADVWSLGIVLYECLAGIGPYEGSFHVVAFRILNEPPPPLAGDTVDRVLEAIVMSCLDKDPVLRPSAREIAERLAGYRAGLAAGESMRLALAPPARQRGLGGTFVGRAAELAALEERLAAACRGECQLVTVEGPAGVGKTRLLSEIEASARLRDAVVLHGRFVEIGRAFPYQGYCEALQELLRSSGPAADELGDLLPELAVLFPVLREIGSAQSQPLPAVEPRFEDRTRVFELLARAFSRIAAHRPLVLLLEDLHGADVSIDALDYLLSRLGATPTLVVGTFRSEEIDRAHPLARLLETLEGDRRFLRLRLEPFGAREHQALLRALLGDELAPGVCDRLYSASEGNPYFTRELVRALLDSGGLARDGSGRWSLRDADSFASQPLPATIQQAVARRLDRLPPASRDLLARASVLGRSFDLAELAVLAPEAELEKTVEELLRDGFLEEDRAARGDRLAFSSAVVREVMYASLTRWRRRTLHRTIAEELERCNAGRLERVAPRLLEHYAQAEVADKAIEYGLTLARKALAAYSPEDAVHAVNAALEFLSDEGNPDPARRAEALLVLGNALRMAGRRDEALRELEAAIASAEQAHEPAIALEAIATAAQHAWEGRRLDRVAALVATGLPLARSEGRPSILRSLLSLGATVANLGGNYAHALALSEEADAIPEARRAAEDLPRGGVLRVGFTVGVSAVHPGGIRLDDELEVLANVFETLIRPNAQGNPMPHLAESWETIDGGKAFRFRLRRGVCFHDGTELRAVDIKASIEDAVALARDTVAPAWRAIAGVEEFAAATTASIAGVRVIGEDAVEITLRERLPIFPALLSDVCTAIARRGSGPTPAWHGTGPFRLASAEAGTVRLERSPRWWRSDSPRLEAIEFITGLGSAEVAARVRNGELDLARDLKPADLEALLTDRRLRASLVETPKKNVYLAVFNSASRSVDREVRRALHGMLPMRDLVRRTLGRFGQPAEGLFPPGIFGHDPARRRHPIRIEEANALLGGAGLTPPLRLRAAVHPIYRNRYAALLEALRMTWGEVGVELEDVTPRWEDFLEAEAQPDGIDLLLGRYVADYDDPDNFCYQLFHSSAGVFRHLFSAPELDELIAAARAETWQGGRSRLYATIEDRLLSEDRIIPLFNEIDARVVLPSVRGLSLRSAPPYVNYASVAKSPDPAGTAANHDSGVIRVPLTTGIGALDPARIIHVHESEICQAVFETLTREVEGARIVPWLAAEVQAQRGGAEYRFRLREDVRFHDGRMLSARDVVSSFERLLLDPGSEGRWLLSPIRGARALLDGRSSSLEGVRILAPLELAIELEEPVAFFPALLAYYAAAIVPEGTERLGGSWREGCVGTGPFRVLRHDPGRRVELEANPHYWRHGLPRCDGITFALRTPPEEVAAGFRDGRFQVAWDLPPAEMDALRRDSSLGALFSETPSLSTYMLVCNVRSGPLATLALRRRVSACVDADALVAATLGTLAIPARGLIPPGLLGHTARRLSRPPAANDTIGGRVPIRLMLHPVYESTFSEVTHVLLEALGQAGFEIQVVPERLGQPGWNAAAVDLLLARWIADYPDPDSFLHGFVHSTKGVAGALCGTPTVDMLIEQGRRETDAESRAEIYRRAEEEMSAQAILVPLFHEQAYRLARPEVTDFAVSFSGPHVLYEQIGLKQRDSSVGRRDSRATAPS